MSKKRLLSLILVASISVVAFQKNELIATETKCDVEISSSDREAIIEKFDIDSIETDGNNIYIEDEGIDYQISAKEFGNNKKITLEYDDTVMHIEIDSDSVTLKEFQKTQSWFGGTQLRKINESETEITDFESQKNEAIGQYSWNKKHTTPYLWGTKYFYQTGVSGYGNTYWQVGKGSDTYRIAYYKLKSGQKNQCKEYKKYVQNCISKYTKAEVAFAGGDIGLATAAIIALVSAAIPGGVIVSILIASVGGYGDSIINLIDSYNNYQNAVDEYNSTKKLGSKV